MNMSSLFNIHGQEFTGYEICKACETSGSASVKDVGHPCPNCNVMYVTGEGRRVYP